MCGYTFTVRKWHCAIDRSVYIRSISVAYSRSLSLTSVVLHSSVSYILHAHARGCGTRLSPTSRMQGYDQHPLMCPFLGLCEFSSICSQDAITGHTG